MPSLSFKSATSTDALNGRTFNVIPQGGAIMNLWIAGANATDVWGLSVGDKVIAVQGSRMNLEAAADSIDTDRDHVVIDEVVGPGQMFMPVTATAEVNVLMHLRYR